MLVIARKLERTFWWVGKVGTAILSLALGLLDTSR